MLPDPPRPRPWVECEVVDSPEKLDAWIEKSSPVPSLLGTANVRFTRVQRREAALYAARCFVGTVIASCLFVFTGGYAWVFGSSPGVREGIAIEITPTRRHAGDLCFVAPPLIREAQVCRRAIVVLDARHIGRRVERRLARKFRPVVALDVTDVRAAEAAPLQAVTFALPVGVGVTKRILS